MENISEIQKQIEKAHLVGDIETEYFLQGELGNNFFSKKDFSQAFKLYQSALSIAEQTHDLMGKGATLSNLGNVYMELGDTEEAKRLYEEALRIAGEVGDRTLEGNTLNNLGLVSDKSEDVEAAKRHYEQALEIARETQNYRLESDVLNNLGLITMQLKETARLNIPYETKKHRRLVTASLILTSLAAFIIVSVWILRSFSLISLGWITAISVLVSLASILGASFGLAAQLLSMKNTHVNERLHQKKLHNE